MATPLQDASGSGFYGKGYWGRKVFWLNVPSQWRHLDTNDYLQKLLNTWGDAGEDLIEQIYYLPYQRDPYTVRARDTWTRWFYVTEAFSYTDDDKGRVVRLVGEKDSGSFPGANLSSPPSSDEDVMEEQFPWYPYEALAEVGRHWQLYFRDAQYEVANVRARNFDQADIYKVSSSLANEIWVTGGDLTLLFDYFTDRLWDTSIEDSALRGTVTIGETDGSQRPAVELPDYPVRLVSRWSDLVPPSMDTTAATVIIRIPLQGGGYRYLYDVPTSENEGTLNSESGGTITSTTAGTINYLSGNIEIDLSDLSEFSSQTISDIKIRYEVQGYYLKFNAPPVIDYLAQDFGFKNDQNDPEDVQRSAIANVTKFWGIKSTWDSYRVRGEISLFDVDMQGLYAICSDDLASQIPDANLYSIGGSHYSDASPVFIRVDHIASDEFFYDADYPAPPGTAAWVQLVDNMLIAEDADRWDGMTIGQAYAVDVTQGYWGLVSPANSNVRGPATVSSVTALTQEELETRGWQNGFKYEIEMKRCQYEAFNMIVTSGNYQDPALFALSVYDYNATPSLGVPPAVNDTYYYIDYQDSVWSLDSSAVDPKEDVGTWTVSIQFGAGVASPISVSDDVAVRYIPAAISMSCCYCRSYKMRASVTVSDEAYDFYDTYAKVESAISRLKLKLDTLVPVQARIVQWDITRKFTDEMFGVQNGALVEHILDGEWFENNVSVNVTVQYRGDSDYSTANTDLDFSLWTAATGTIVISNNWNPDVSFAYDNEASGPFIVGEPLSWTGGTGVLSSLTDNGTIGSMSVSVSSGVVPSDGLTITGGTSSATCDVDGTVTSGAGDNETWVDVVSDTAVTLPSGPVLYDVHPTVQAGSALTYGDVRWVFTVNRIEED